MSGTSVPTQEELAGVAILRSSLDPDTTMGEEMVDQFEAAITTRSPAPFRDDEEPAIFLPNHSEGLLLTRTERQLIHGRFGGLENIGDDYSDIELDVEPEQGIYATQLSPPWQGTHSPRKRPYEASHSDTAPSSPSKRQRMAMHELAAAHSQLSQITCSSISSSQNNASHIPVQQPEVLDVHPPTHSSEPSSVHWPRTSQADGPQSSDTNFVECSPPISQSRLRDNAVTPAHLMLQLLNIPHTTAPLDASSHPTPPAENRLSKLVHASITNFRLLKGHNVSETHIHEEVIDYQAPDTPPPDAPAPGALTKPVLNGNSIVLPLTWPSPLSTHRYIASVGLIQKRRIASALSRNETGRAELLEDPTLQGNAAPDLILDPQHAAIFFSLSSLPSTGRELMTRLKAVLPCYDNILLVFEAYPPSQSYSLPTIGGSAIRQMTGSKEPMRDRAQATQVDIFSPPVIQALKRFRRELIIEQELINDEVRTISVETVCALNPEEAVMYTRSFGDHAESECYEREVGKALWGSRTWLQEEEDEVCTVP